MKFDHIIYFLSAIFISLSIGLKCELYDGFMSFGIFMMFYYVFLKLEQAVDRYLEH